MKHTMIDCYGANTSQLDDIKLVNQLLTDIVYKLGLDPICPPFILPYYYGKVKEDIGISSYVLLVGGHITIHTFPLRECYFVDLFSQDDYDEKKLHEMLQKVLPYSENKSVCVTKDRLTDFEMQDYNPADDFGPHLMLNINSNKKITMEDMFDFLENTAYQINMDPITRPCILKSTIDDPKYLSGIIVIAQSHISLHYNYETNKLYGDVFSCAPFDFSTVEGVFSKLGNIESTSFVARGTKHIYKVKSDIANDDLLANTKWQKVIKNNK